ncbi:acyl-CoA thioesterase [Streptomyces fuscigenes]|uniref:acyl-CoA thioesterase n=1 Tax=Streptomyces fuscigenes TaxID=1528880 RepID=UPI001F4640DF|nr:acyl-CoA thioesterase [Streptomyces fuscigenes]MCF3960695.1 acyl-CoA thioesterase [Streptomyces fuscigenes]
MSTYQSGGLGSLTIPRPSSVDVSLRWGDVDSYGHVNNCEIVRIIEEARMRWLMSAGVFEGETAVVASHEIGYLRPLHYSLEPVSVEVWTSNIKRSSFEFNFQILDASKRVSVKAVSRMVMFDLAKQESYLIGPALRDHLSGFAGERL